MTDLIQWFQRIFIDASVTVAGVSVNLIRVVGFIAVVGIFVIIARGARRLLRPFLTRLNVEDTTQERLLWIVTLVLLVAGVVIGLDSAVGINLTALYQVLTFSVPIGQTQLSFAKLLWFVAVIVGAAIFSKYVRLVLRDRVLPPFQLAENAQFLLLRLVHIVIVLCGVLIGLNLTGLSVNNLTVVLGGLGIGIGFGLQNIANNLVSGLILIFERPIRVGDRVTVGDTFGTVRAINMRSTEIANPDNISIIVPNSQFISETITNWTYSDRVVRIRIAVGVAYGSDTARVKQALLEVAESHPDVFNGPHARLPMVRAPLVRFLNFGDSSLDFELLAWIPDVERRLDIPSDLHFMVEQKFREYDISIPFPQRDVHLYGETETRNA